MVYLRRPRILANLTNISSTSKRFSANAPEARMCQILRIITIFHDVSFVADSCIALQTTPILPQHSSLVKFANTCSRMCRMSLVDGQITYAGRRCTGMQPVCIRKTVCCCTPYAEFSIQRYAICYSGRIRMPVCSVCRYA